MECRIVGWYYILLVAVAFIFTQNEAPNAYDTKVRGEEMLRLCRADLPNCTKSCGKY